MHVSHYSASFGDQHQAAPAPPAKYSSTNFNIDANLANKYGDCTALKPGPLTAKCPNTHSRLHFRFGRVGNARMSRCGGAQERLSSIGRARALRK